MDERGVILQRIFICALVLSLHLSLCNGASVSNLDPNYGSLGGETRLTIYGSGFSADQFSQDDDPNTGNRVYLVGESGSEYSCPVHRDGSTEVQVMCFTPEGMAEENHYVKVVVEGVTVPDDDLCGGNPTSSKCRYKPQSANTPTIDTLTPQSGLPGSFVTLNGKLMSDRYGSNMNAATNLRTEKLLRTYVGPQDCGLKDGDDFYHLALNNEDSDMGTLKCLTKGTSVGFYNASFIIESPFGRSLPKSSMYRVAYNDQIYMFQSYTDITSVSPALGSTAGGLTLTIYGNYFDDRSPYVAPRAYIAGTECTITNVVIDEYIECLVTADPQDGNTEFEGNRGVNFEFWTSTSKSQSNMDDILALTSASPGYNDSISLDETYFYDASSMDNYVSRMTTLFRPPHSGEYQFFLSADDGARLFIDGVSVATSTGNWAGSSRMNLQDNKRYLLKVVHYENSGSSYIHLMAKFFDTKFTNAWTGKATQDQQTISISSTIEYDVQRLSFNNFISKTGVKEVQNVEVDTPGEFRFGLFGVYTEPLSSAMDDIAISTALNTLPIFDMGESLSVVRNPTTPPSFQITFESMRGDFPDISVIKVANSSDVTSSVTESVRGVPDMDVIALSMSNSISLPFSVSDTSANKLLKIITGMFEAKCPDIFESSKIAKYYESFESGLGKSLGEITRATEPFCGRHVLKNPRRLYKKADKDLGLMLSSYGMVCFAYKGLFTNRIFVRYSLKQFSDDETVSKYVALPFTFQTDTDTSSDTWYYTCVNVYDEILSRHSSDTEHRLDQIWVSRQNSAVDCYVDSVFIGKDETINDPEINKRRFPALMPNGALINTVTVSSSGANSYTVTLEPFDCGNKFPLFELGNGQVSSGRLSYPSTAATLTLLNGGSGSMSVNRSSFASPPVTGYIDITFNGNTRTNLNVSLEEGNFDKELESLDGIGSLQVKKTGDCANFDMSVTFLTLPGDLPQMSVVYGNLAGINAQGSIATNVDGGLDYDPLTGDMLSTVHSKPQVRLYINDVPVACTGDCSFEWDSSVTPSVTSISPSSGTSALSTSAVISGTGFNSGLSGNTVTIGGVACVVTAATTTSITCDIGNGPVGDYKVMILVEGKGDADHTSGNVTFTYTADITGISPTSGSLGGGVILTISGYGFKSDATVAINSEQCSLVTVQADEITCTVPVASAGTEDVTISQGSVTLSYTGFTYDSSLTARISSVSPSSISVQGDTVTISGSSFGVSQSTVFIGTTPVTVTSWSDTQVVVETGAMKPGNVQIQLKTTNGFAVDNSGALPVLSVDLSITNVFPLAGSLLGGTKLTITGAGFGSNDSIVDVKVGAVECDISAVTNTRIDCQIAKAGTVHQITNRGSDPAFGVYYAFDKPHITINRGDFVQWTWETPVFVNNIAHAIIETDSPSAVTPKDGGFSSGTPTKNGQWKYQFTNSGTYYAWSGYVDEWGIKNYVGTIEVVDATSILGEISVQVAGQEALHNIGGASDPVDSSGCQPVTSAKSGCVDSRPTGGVSDKFNFAFWTCSTPIVTAIDRNNGTVQTTVSISGEGLSSIGCQNEVSIDDAYTCSVTSSSDSLVTCMVAKSGEPELGVMHPVSVRVGNRGYALMNIMTVSDRSFGLIPNIDDIQPTSGSMAGGAEVTISGFGFGDSPLVYIGGYTCDILTHSYTEIKCESPASGTQEAKDVTVHAYVGGSPIPAECETSTKTCRFSYALIWTPTVISISQNNMSGTTDFNIVGSGLGSITTDLQVSIGGITATVTSASDTVLEATIQNVPAGSNDVIVKVQDYGKASGSLVVTGDPVISTITPSSGSIHGETTITIQGNGFVDGQTTVTLNGTTCDIMSVTLAEVKCLTRPHAAGNVNLDVTSNGVAYTSDSYSYDMASTPTIASVSPMTGLAGSTLTITGTNLEGGSQVVLLDDILCNPTSSSSTEIQCTIGNHATGAVPVSVHVEDLGASNTDVEFEYELSLSTIQPVQGGTAGGQTVVFTGTGFDNTASATICGLTCPLVTATSTTYTCKTPANTAQTCDVVISMNGLSKTLAGVYTYNAALTPSVSSVSPSRGGTGGGTTLTVTGSGFGVSAVDVAVMIDGTACVVSSPMTDTELECVTGPHMGSVVTKVEVEVSGNGIAQEVSAGDSEFQYIDVWSSVFTWGGVSVPQEGEFVLIPAGMTLLLDTDTPRLDFLLIQGGKLIFDEQDIELNANIIMITDGGLLQVGTETAPFQHKAIITMHGHHRSKELPIYGTKVLAVRNGTLDLHGKEVPITWTKLAATAASGSTTLELVHAVEWNVGDEIVIAATGHHHTQSENEKKTISAISLDKQTLTLSTPLEAEHVGEEETFDGTLVEFRAEVGLLTHNVVFRGNTDPQWEDEIKACEAGFNTGEFAVQTCFLGRFGDEIGSSQFGAMILVHAPVMNTHEAQARISFIEVTFAGQAFRLGRYPIHFHLNGDMSTSYVRGCGIHQTFNRAVNIHGTHNTIVEKTVIYNIMGGAFFLEDGIETGNTLQFNLAVFVRESSSLLNDDITPASFWVTNPNNTVQHNAAAGGTHFGYWYRMHSHPDGPSFTSDVCCQNVPLGVFENNTAHSFGWFGLWIFENYFPMVGGCGGTEVEPAVFRGLTAWNNDKGAEAVNSGALQFENFVLVQNKKAGYEGKKVINVPLYTDDSPMIKDSLIVAKTTVIPSGVQGCTTSGIVFPYGFGFRAVDIRFVNFDESGCTTFAFTRIAGTCSINCGGYNYHTEGLSFINSPNKARYAWDWEGIIIDKDGTATGKGAGNWSIIPTTGTLPSDCEPAPEYSIGQPASMCPPQYTWHRFAFNNINPASIEGKDFVITNQYGNSSVQFMKKRLTHKPGWMCVLIDGEAYSWKFENADQIKNISFTGQFYNFESSDHIIIKIPVEDIPDRFSIDGGKTFINATTGGLDPTTNVNGDWEWDNANKEINFMVHGTKRSRRATSSLAINRPFSFSLYKCYFTDCIPPPDPNTIPPVDTRPLQFQYWDDLTVWNMSADGYVTNSEGNYGIPQDFDNVKIVFGEWMIVNMTTVNKFGVLLLEGVMEFIDTPGANYEINADFIIIRGGRLIIGWPDDPFDGLANIILRGNHSSPYFDAGDGPVVGSKAIGVFGGLDLFGKDVGVTWTLLDTTADAGSNQIVLSEPVTWRPGDDIVIAPTSFNPWETESFQITAVAADNVTLTLNETLKYKHIVHQETLSNGVDITVGAVVGLLTRNIKIIGESYDSQDDESFGARVLVGLITYGTQTYAGYARLSNVEFYRTGQEGFTEDYDPRFSVAYVAVGTVSNVKPSSVTSCSFHNGFNTAVGAFGIGSLNITDNIVFGSVGNGLRTSSDDTRLIGNFVTLMVATNSYQDRLEEFNPRWEAGIEAMEAKNLVLQDNLVAGSERVAYHVVTQACDVVSDSYRNNRAFANVIGVVVLPDDSLPQSTCARLSGFTVWKTHDFGIYYQNSLDVVLDDNVLIDNNNGLIAIMNGPSAVGHAFANKLITVSNTTFVGATSSFDCQTDVKPSADDNFMLSANSRPGLAPNGGKVGLIFPNFYQGSNKAPKKPWKGCMSYNAIGGLMKVSDVTFAKYGTSACNGDYAVSTNAGNDDGQHPVEAERITFIDVEDDFKIVYHRPNVGKINSADCVDMDCDALKKALFKDLDGSFLGHVGAVIPQSEYEWGGDPRRGLGDYRIPKEMVTTMDGTRIPYADIAPNKGIIRNSNCTYRSSWQAYDCKDTNYEMLMIESMDSDTETRRLSPVAILGNGYIDLINGPQDHGWCSGYTCRKRLSTFMSLVATDEEYLLHFTSTTPKNMRYRLLNARSSEAIKLTVWYSQPNRLDVFVDDSYVIATNARIDSNGRYIISMPKGNEYLPMLSNVTGTNYFDRDRGEISFIMKGSQKIDVISRDTIIVSYGIPSLTVSEFFGDNIVENLAAFLNIPLTKVRVVNVVSATSGSRRRRRNAEGINVELEIGDEPMSNANDTAPDSIDYASLVSIATIIVDECQVGNVSETLNMTGSCNSVELPSEDPSVASITYNTPSPDVLVFYAAPTAHYEGVLLQTQPKIQTVDISNIIVTSLGTTESPWQLTASLRPGTGHTHASLDGTLTINATNGWFNFTDLSISHMGSGYIIDFNVSSPSAASNFTLESSPMDVPGRPMKVNMKTVTSGNIVRNARFSTTLELKDQNTGVVIPNIAWRNHTWTAEVSLLGPSTYGSLEGVLATAFDPTSGEALFPDLNITGFGIYYLQFRVVSSPADFNLTLNRKLHIVHPNHVGMVIEEQYEVKVKFDVDYNTVLSSEDKQNEFEQMILTEYANLWPDVQLSTGSITEGSIVVTFVIDGTLADVNATAYSMCDSIYNGTSYSYNGYTLTLSPYLTINNLTYYGVTCGEILSEENGEDDSGLETYQIVLIVLGSLLFIAAIAAVVFWKLKIVPKSKTHEQGIDNAYLGQNNLKTGMVVPFRENTFTSMKFNMGGAAAPTPPTMTKLGYNEPMSGLTVYPDTQQPVNVAKLMSNIQPTDPDLPANTASSLDVDSGSQMDVRSASPSFLHPYPMPVYVEPHDPRNRNPSPVPSCRSTSPMLNRPNSAFSECDSPLPPVGDTLYNSDYITTPIPGEITPYMPPPSPQPRTKAGQENTRQMHF